MAECAVRIDDKVEPEPELRKEDNPVFPFMYNNRLHSTCLQTLKMIIVGIFLFLPRAILFAFSFLMCYIICKFMLCCTTPEEVQQYPLRRVVSRFFLRVFNRLLLFSLGYWWICVDKPKKQERRTNRSPDSVTPLNDTNKAGQDEEAPIVVSNHVSFVDAFIFGYLEMPMVLAKAELLHAPIVGTIGLAQQTIGVSRETAGARHGVVDEINRRTKWRQTQPASVLEQYGDWPNLLIFPEATCVNTTSVIQFKEGAFIPMMPVQPVALDFRQSYLDVSWVGRMSVPLTIVRMMCQIYNRCHVQYLPIMHPDGESDTPQAFAARAQHEIARALNIPTTQHNFLDVLLTRQVRLLKLPTRSVNMQMGSYPDGLEYAKMKLREFAALDKDKKGKLGRKEFAILLGFRTEEEREANQSIIDALLSHWDRDQDGNIDFREFLLFSASLTIHHSIEKKKAAVQAELDKRKRKGEPITDEGILQEGTADEELRHALGMAFGAFDADHDNRISRDELLAGLQTVAPQVRSEEVTQLFNQADSDSDGYITLEEWLAFCQDKPYLISALMGAISLSATSEPSAEELSQLSRTNSFVGTPLEHEGSSPTEFDRAAQDDDA